MAAPKNGARSPNKSSGWGENLGGARSRSRSPERFSGAAPAGRSFHETMMNEGGLPSYGNANTTEHKTCDEPQSHQDEEAAGGSHNNDVQECGVSPPGQPDGTISQEDVTHDNA